MSRNRLAIILIGAILGRAFLFNSISPFGIAYVGAVGAAQGALAIWSLFGVMIGVLSRKPTFRWFDPGALGYLVILVLVYLISHWLYTRAVTSRWSVGAAVGGATIAAGLIARAGLRPGEKGMILVAFEAGLAGIIASGLFQGRSVYVDRHAAGRPEALVLLLAGLVAGLAGIQVGRFSVGNIIGGACVAGLALLGGAGPGAAGGAMIGLVCAMSMSQGRMLPLAGAYAFGGLIAGLCRDYGKAGVAAGFALGGAMLAFQVISGPAVPVFIAENFLASLLFLIMPGGALPSIKNMVPVARPVRNRDVACARRLQKQISKKLGDFSRIFEELASNLDHMPQANPARDRAEAITLIHMIMSLCCSNCISYYNCWAKNFYKTYRDLLDLVALAELKGDVGIDDLSGRIGKWCIQTSRLVETVNKLLQNYSVDRHWMRKLAESRLMVSGQLRGISDMMRGLAAELAASIEFDVGMEDLIARRLAEVGLPADEVSVIRSKERKYLDIIISKHACGSAEECRRAMAPIVSAMVGQPLIVWGANCDARKGRPVCEFHLTPARNLRVTVAVTRVARDHGGVSGDAYSTRELSDGRFAIVLSDGMGVGPQAAAESTTAVSMLERLIEAGFDHEFSVKTVNSILLLRSPGETFATVDLAVLDLFTGDTEFIKIGSSPSFVKRGEEIITVRSSSLPAGIFSAIDVEGSRKRLVDGDILIMVSDGVIDSRVDPGGKDEWFVRMLKRIDSDDPHYIARVIVEKARENTGGRLFDDMTVIVARVDRQGRGRSSMPHAASSKTGARLKAGAI
ncbi:MAG: stage II sporulation protein E [Firmicutes bacterium]|nr:stage II sporulation protein E [Bacillota bacterium]